MHVVEKNPSPTLSPPLPSFDPMTEPTELCCNIEGQPSIFFVYISHNRRIDNLITEIYNKGGPDFFDGCGPLRLNLTKVCYIMISM